jgi:hypothetical protein
MPHGFASPSCTSERGGKGDCVKEGGGEEGERDQPKRALGVRLRHSPQVEQLVDPPRRRLGRRFVLVAMAFQWSQLFTNFFFMFNEICEKFE